jgi:nicotinamidase-related amidase
MTKQAALVVIDLQRGMFEGAGGPLDEADTVLARVAGMLAKARARGQPVIYVRHDGGPGDELQRDAPLWPIDARIAPKDSEPIVDKTEPSAFENTDMRELLKARGIDSLVICGAQSDCCVRATAQAAHQAGYGVTVVKDAHSTIDSPEGKAKDLRQAINDELAAAGIGLMPAAAF